MNETEATETADLADRWFREISAVNLLPLTAADARAWLGRLAVVLVRAVSAEPFRPEVGYDVGARLVHGHVTAGDALGRTVRLFAGHLAGRTSAVGVPVERPVGVPVGRPVERLGTVGAIGATTVAGVAVRPGDTRAHRAADPPVDRIAHLLGELVRGHTEALRERTLDGQEATRRADLGARERAERERRISQTRLHAVFHNTALGMIVADRAGHILEASNAALDILGLTARHPPVAWPLIEIVHPADRETLSRLWHEAGQGRARGECRVLRPDGTLIWVALTLSTTRPGTAGDWFLVAMIEDITEHRRLQEQLRFRTLHDPLTGLANRAAFLDRLEAAFRARTPGLRVGLCYIDLDRFRSINEGFGHLVGDQLLIEVARRLDRVLATAPDPARIDEEQALPEGPGPEQKPEQGSGSGLEPRSESDSASGSGPGSGSGSGSGSWEETAPREGRVPSGTQPLVARMGGDEFMILIPDCAGIDDVTAIARRVMTALREPVSLDGRDLPVTCSIGVVEMAADESSPSDLVAAADASLTWAKSGGKNRWTAFDPDRGMREATRILLSRSMSPGLARGEFSLVYQPIVDLRRETVAGAEALVRWDHPRLGLRRPGEFIALAEDSGFIVQLGLWVLERACEAARDWPSHMFISVNLSGRQLREPGLVTAVEKILARTGLPPERLQLELTESVLMDTSGEQVRTLQALNALGTRIVIDDFGTGWSNFAYLCTMPVRGVKLAGLFVAKLGQGAEPARDDHLVEAIVEFAGKLRLSVTAEGVETAAQAAALRAFGTDLGQGHLFGEAMPDGEFATRVLGRAYAGT